jgi:choline kinase
MQAVILAAGRGLRMNGSLDGRPKCLVEVGGRTLLEHQLDALRALGVRDICVVVGHGAAEVRALVGADCHCVENPRYRETNSLYSLWLARDWVCGSFLVLNADVLACPEIYRRVAGLRGNALAYDSRSGHEDEHMKVRLTAGRLARVAKDLGREACDGENVGILHFDEDAARELFAQAEAMIAGGLANAWAPAAVDRIAARFRIQAVDVAGLPWIEIDYPGDLELARREVWPAIRSGTPPLADDLHIPRLP